MDRVITVVVKIIISVSLLADKDFNQGFKKSSLLDIKSERMSPRTKLSLTSL